MSQCIHAAMSQCIHAALADGERSEVTEHIS